ASKRTQNWHIRFGQTWSFDDVGPMSGLLEIGHGALVRDLHAHFKNGLRTAADFTLTARLRPTLVRPSSAAKRSMRSKDALAMRTHGLTFPLGSKSPCCMMRSSASRYLANMIRRHAHFDVAIINLSVD